MLLVYMISSGFLDVSKKCILERIVHVYSLVIRISSVACLQVEECSSLENLFHNSCSCYSFERFHTIVLYWNLWVVWARRTDYV